MLGAFLLGMGAAFIAGILWFAISVVTGYQIGYVAIGVGFLIGYAVLFGSGKKRGMPLQIMSAAMTLVTLFASQYFITLFYIRKYLLENKAQFPDYTGQWFLVNPFSPDIIASMISPIGLLIWAVGIYFAYSLPKSRSI
jgi:Ca2+/H+ antiporter